MHQKGTIRFRGCVNLLSSSVYDLLEFGELKSTSGIMKLANKSIKVPHGMIRHFSQVDEFFFPVDLLVLDMEHCSNPGQIPIILG